jgi:GGDEF domain-containing protein
VLIDLGGFLRSSSREGDILARIGGEEFVILFVECTLEQVLTRLK